MDNSQKFSLPKFTPLCQPETKFTRTKYTPTYEILYTNTNKEISKLDFQIFAQLSKDSP